MASRATLESDALDLLYAEDVAALVGMTPHWVYRETRAGRIPHLRLGRFYRYRRESIRVWLRELERGGAENPPPNPGRE